MKPKGWVHCRFEDLFRLKHGFAFPSEGYSDQGTHILVTPGNFLEEGGFRHRGSDEKFFVGPIPDDYVLNEDDVLVVMTEQAEGLLGSAAYIPATNRYLHNQRLGRVVDLDSRRLSKNYLCFLFNSLPVRRQISVTASGTKVRHTSPDKIGEVEVCLPPLPEQQKIADILGTWDEALEKLDALIAAKDRRKQALMQQLLTGQRRLPGFSKPWVKSKLSELFLNRTENNRLDLPLLSITADQGVVSRDSLTKRDTSSEDKSKYLRIAPGDIGYNTMRMWQGVSALSSLEGIVSPAYTILAPTDRIDGKFAAHFFKLPHTISLFHRYSQGLVDDTLNLKFPAFAAIEVTVPAEVAEQRAIAAVLDTADAELLLLRQQRAALDQQKRGLMQQLLTGKKRIP